VLFSVGASGALCSLCAAIERAPDDRFGQSSFVDITQSFPLSL
jgi:hypothetical protein